MTGADTIQDLRDVKRCPDCGTGFGREGAFCPFDGTALETSTWDPTGDPLTGSVVAQRYQVLAPLGEGGMGTVYKVRHMTLDRTFAMKVLRRDLAKDPALAARFMQEARATAAIHHPSVVAINDFGNLEPGPSTHGAPYFVMEHLAGETLATYLNARGVLEPRIAAAIARKIAEALHAAHAVGVVHRDLKPENVFLVGVTAKRDPSLDVRIVDFGAAKIMGGSALTRPGIVFGTPYYMSPEQASGAPLDGRADVYSLGVLLYEMITGTVPFEADTYMGVLTKHMFESPTRPSERRPGVPLGALEDIVLRALEKEPPARFPSMQAFAEALAKTDGGTRQLPRPVTGTERMLPAPPGGHVLPLRSAADRIESSVSRQVELERRRQRRLVAFATLGAVGALGLLALFITLVRDDRPGATSSTAAPLATTPAPPPAASTWVPPPDPPGEPSAASRTTSPSAPSSAAAVPPATSTVTTADAADDRRAAAGKGTGASGGRPRSAAAAEPSARPAPADKPAAAPASTPRASDEFKDPWKSH